MEKIIVGLSGGVDSAVAAAILKDQYEVIGVTLRMQGGCFVCEENEERAIADAKAVADKLNIEHVVIDMRKEFENVKDNFVDAYLNARTPNPCVLCNPTVKWKALIDYADKVGAEKIATGHYAFVDKLDNGRYALRTAQSDKDQTYALYGLSQQQLARTVMPLGEVSGKDEVRELAKKLELPIFDKPDSMEICFIPDDDYASYIREHSVDLGDTAAGCASTNSAADAATTNSAAAFTPGNFVDEDGKILGEHKGLIHYTIGQRKGLGIAFGTPMFVKELKPETNEVVLSSNEALFTDTLIAEKVNLMGAATLNPGKLIEQR